MSDAAAPAAPEGASGIRQVTDGYRRYALFLLLTIYIFNFIDRSVVNILAEDIRNELGLLDWQIGLMSGFAFAVFYTFLGLPIARFAESNNRPWIIGAALAAWSAFTALCGFAQNFVQLVLARIGVGVGEAGCTPPAHSLITDYVPKEKRASALAFYSMGTPLGGLVGLAVGGIVADAYGWRMAFLVCGLPGVVLAVIAVLTLIEPRTKQVMAEVRARQKSAQGDGANFGQVMKVLATKSAFWLIALAAAVKAFIGYGHAPFTNSYFQRNFPDQIAELASTFGLQANGFMGLALGVMGGIAGAIGSLLGGWIADRYGARDLRAYVSVPGIASLITIPVYITAVSVDSVVVALCLLSVNGVLGTLWYGPVYATAQTIVPSHMRATAAAILLFVINLIGLGLGPLVVGFVSDYFSVGLGYGPAQGVRWALIVSALAGFLAFGMFWLARSRIRTQMVG